MFIGAVILSFGLNLIFFIAVGLFITKRGGYKYVSTKIKAVLGTVKEVPVMDKPYYNERVSLFDSLPCKSGSIVFLGDSLSDNSEWGELLSNPNVVNRGIRGDTTDGVLKRLDGVIDSKPSKLFLMVGVNDLIYKSTPVRILANHETIIKQIQLKSADTEIFIQSILPVYNYLHVSNGEIRFINNGLKKICIENNLIYIDLYPELANDNQELDPSYTFDGIHLKGEAYLKWRDEIQRHVE